MRVSGSPSSSSRSLPVLQGTAAAGWQPHRQGDGLIPSWPRRGEWGTCLMSGRGAVRPLSPEVTKMDVWRRETCSAN